MDQVPEDVVLGIVAVLGAMAKVFHEAPHTGGKVLPSSWVLAFAGAALCLSPTVGPYLAVLLGLSDQPRIGMKEIVVFAAFVVCAAFPWWAPDGSTTSRS